MNKKDLANAFDLLEPTQETKYNVRNTINSKSEGKKPFFKRFKRPAVAMTCFAIASILVITACAAGGIQLFSLIYGSEVAKYEKYISDASEPVSTENVSFTLEGVFYDGYNGIAIVSLEALSETGKEMIEQFNQDITTHVKFTYPHPDDLTGMEFYAPDNPDNPAEHPLVICSKHMIITKESDQKSLDCLFTTSSLTGALGDDKNYYKIIWFNGERDLPKLQIGWTDNEETVLTDFDVSLVTNTIEIDCSETETATPEFIGPYKIVVSPMAVYVCTINTNNLKIDDQFLIKFTDGSIYDLMDGGRYYLVDAQMRGDYHEFQEDDKRKGGLSRYSFGEHWIDGDQSGCNETNIYFYRFGELVDASTIESIFFFGVEYKLR